MVAAGAHPLIIQGRIGHASVSTTMDIYGHVLPEVDERVARDLGALFGDDQQKIWGPGELGVLVTTPRKRPDLGVCRWR